MAENDTVEEGIFAVIATDSNGKTETFDRRIRKLQVIGGHIVITNKESGVVTILSPGSKVITSC